MGIAGGLSLAGIGMLEDAGLRRFPLAFQMMVSAVLITAIELYSGMFSLRVLHYRMWDYSALPFSFCDGLICPWFSGSGICSRWLGFSYGLCELLYLPRGDAPGVSKEEKGLCRRGVRYKIRKNNPGRRSSWKTKKLSGISRRIVPDHRKAATEIINLQSVINLPKGTEHFLSDIHGEYEAFSHVLRNGSGAVRKKIDDVFGHTLGISENVRLQPLSITRESAWRWRKAAGGHR